MAATVPPAERNNGVPGTLRIAHLVQARVRGGLVGVVEALGREQARDGEVLVAAPLPAAAGTPPAVRWCELGVAGNSDLRGLHRVRAALAGFAPDAVFLHAGSPGEWALAAALLVRRWPTLVVEHLPEHYPLRRPLRDLALARLKRRATRWLAVSRAGARHLEALWRLPAETIRVVHNGVDAPPDEAPAALATELGAGGELVLGLGRPEARKGFDTFLAVAGALAMRRPDARFVWVGGERRERRERVSVLPWTSAVGWLLRRAALLLVPSRAEGLPLVLLEAWACATPVVASAVGGIPEAMTAGVDGLLLPAGDAAAWVQAVDDLLGDDAKRRAFAVAGHATWSARFTAAAMAARYRAEIAAAVREGPAGAASGL